MGMDDRFIDESAKETKPLFSGPSVLNEDLIRLGRKCFQEQRFDKAEEIFRRIIGENPENREALNDLGCLLFTMKQYDESISIFRRIRENQPGDMQAYINLSCALWETQNHEEALQEMEKAHVAAPDNPKVLWNYAQILMRLGKLEKAAEECRSFIEKYSEDQEISSLYNELNARISKKKVLEQPDREKSKAMWDHGQNLIKEKKYVEALEVYRKLKDMRPGDKKLSQAMEGLKRLISTRGKKKRKR